MAKLPSIDKEATIANVLVAASLASATTSFNQAKFNEKMEQPDWEPILKEIAVALRAPVVYLNQETSV